MAVNIITIEDLKTFKQELIDEITTILKSTKANKHNNWLKSSDVRKMLGLSAGTLQTLRINGSIPYTKLNGTLYYSYDDVVEALEKNKKDNSVK